MLSFPLKTVSDRFERQKKADKNEAKGENTSLLRLIVAVLAGNDLFFLLGCCVLIRNPDGKVALLFRLSCH
jgi:hypothetical protein